MLSGSRSVSSVTIIHTTVVASVVVNTFFANRTVADPVNKVGRPTNALARPCHSTETVTTSAAIMAEISLQALMRHQYHRSIYTLPVPAPTWSTTCQPARMEADCAEM